MASIVTPYQENIHQVGLTVAWSVILNLAILCAAMRYDRLAALAHATFGFMILILTFLCIFIFLIPYGFNLNKQQDWQLYAHGIAGLMLLGFVIIEVGGGLAYKLLRQGQKTDIFKLRILRTAHRVFGYCLAIFYKFINIYFWLWIPDVSKALLCWEICCITAYILIKTILPKLQNKIIDEQTKGFICPQVNSTRSLDKITGKYIIFGNYAYDASDLTAKHPGGYKVIELVMGREVDRFLYGMYSAELYPELLPYSHSASCLQLVGNPIAKIVTPATFDGFISDVCEGCIKYVSQVSRKTQIYAIGIVQKSLPFRYLGYYDVRQLGQFYSLTINNKTTRLYTAVNFLIHQNLQIMEQLLQLTDLKMSYRTKDHFLKNEVELLQFKLKNSNALTEKFDDKKEYKDYESYVPLMLKVYDNGKLTAALKQSQFYDMPVKISAPRGKGLELETTKPGRIIVVIGGTGLFPFSDLIDLLYKSKLIAEKHPQQHLLLQRDPILAKQPFSKFHFTFLIALNEPEDIHPVTLAQLIYLSEGKKSIEIVMRISKNADKLEGKAGSIAFTRQYFNKRVLTEAAKEGLSRVWICGPPKLNSDTGKILIDNGYSMDKILFL